MATTRATTMRARAAAAWHRAGEPFGVIMGRPAVWVVIAYLQAPALVQLLTSVSPSRVIGSAGPAALAYTWAGCVVLAGALMIGSAWRRDPAGAEVLADGSDRTEVQRVLDAAEDERVLEVAAATLVSVLSIVYIAAAIETTDVVLSLTLNAILAALATNLLGRSALLLRQVLAIRRLRREIAL